MRCSGERFVRDKMQHKCLAPTLLPSSTSVLGQPLDEGINLCAYGRAFEQIV